MSTNKSLSSYQDVREALDKALESPNGILIRLGDKGKAIHLIQRIYTFRTADRKKAKEIYPEGHPMHGESPYDVITCREVEGDVMVVRPPPLDLELL